MGKVGDPAIKLFGRTIPLSEDQQPLVPVQDTAKEQEEAAGGEQDSCEGKRSTVVIDPKLDVLVAFDHVDHSNPSTNSNEVDFKLYATAENKHHDARPQQEESNPDTSVQEKVLKKPHKILPCPRCNSMDTKFCYYNNYNVNQPRHFCKNCQRYWTAGGTMRNVPVGAGRRKNKHISSNYRHFMMSNEGQSPTHVQVPDPTHQQILPCGLSPKVRPLNANGTVLKFGPEAPLCESMASVLNLGDQARPTVLSHGENMEEPSCVSSVTASNCLENESSKNIIRPEESGVQSCGNGVAPIPSFHCYPGPPWTYPWAPTFNCVSAMPTGNTTSGLVHRQDNSSSPIPTPWGLPPMMAAPAFCAPPFPFPFIPSSFWGCVTSWPAGPWNVPLVGSNGSLSPSSSTSNSNSSSNGSPTLGKHSRDAGSAEVEKCLWVPKTLRIDDPDEAAKSSIWETIGIKPDDGSIFQSFQSNAEGKARASEPTQVLHVNPAALSRPQAFQENT